MLYEVITVVDAPDRGVLVEKARDLERGRVLVANPQSQRFHAAVEKEAGVRIERAAEVIDLVADVFHQFRARDHRAGHDVVV